MLNIPHLPRPGSSQSDYSSSSTNIYTHSTRLRTSAHPTSLRTTVPRHSDLPKGFKTSTMSTYKPTSTSASTSALVGPTSLRPPPPASVPRLSATQAPSGSPNASRRTTVTTTATTRAATGTSGSSSRISVSTSTAGSARDHEKGNQNLVRSSRFEDADELHHQYQYQHHQDRSVSLTALGVAIQTGVNFNASPQAPAGSGSDNSINQIQIRVPGSKRHGQIFGGEKTKTNTNTNTNPSVRSPAAEAQARARAINARRSGGGPNAVPTLADALGCVPPSSPPPSSASASSAVDMENELRKNSGREKRSSRISARSSLKTDSTSITGTCRRNYLLPPIGLDDNVCNKENISRRTPPPPPPPKDDQSRRQSRIMGPIRSNIPISYKIQEDEPHARSSVRTARADKGTLPQSTTPVFFQPLKDEQALVHEGLHSEHVHHTLNAAIPWKNQQQQQQPQTDTERPKHQSPMLSKMKSAFHLKSSSLKVSRSNSLKNVENRPGTPSSMSSQGHRHGCAHINAGEHEQGLSKTKSSFNLSRFKSHKHREANLSTSDSTYVQIDESYESRKSTSHLSTYSDWSFASMTECDNANEERPYGLPLPSDLDDSQERYVKKKTSMAASLLLGKIFKGKQGNGTKSSNKSSGVRSAGRERTNEQELRTQESSLTIRPQNASPRSTRSSPSENGSNCSSHNSTIEAMSPRPALSLVRRASAVLNTGHAVNDTGRFEFVPQLPSLHFSRPSYSGANFRVDLSDISYVSRFNYGAKITKSAVPESDEPVSQTIPVKATINDRSKVHSTKTAGHHNRISSGFPQRKSLRDVFDLEVNVPAATGDLNLPQLKKQLSAGDIRKVSKATANLEDLIHDFESDSSPSTLNLTDQFATHNASPFTNSSSEQQYDPADSPTPIREKSAPLLSLHPRPKINTAADPSGNINPLRFALRNQNLPEPQDIVFGGKVDSETVGMNHRREESVDTYTTGSPELPSFGLPQQPPMHFMDPELSTASTALSAVHEDVPRSSFDFTGEYAQLSREGDRTSFIEVMKDAGLMPGPNPLSLSTSSTTDQNTTANRPRNVFYGLGSAFKLGGPSPTEMESSGSTHLTPSPPKPQPPAQYTVQGSVFSFSSMSSLGRLVNTGIAGENNVNVFDREFGATAEDPMISSVVFNGKLASEVQDWTSTSFAQLREQESYRSIQQYGTAPRHFRQPSNMSSRSQMFRPRVDSDRMFGTALRAAESKDSLSKIPFLNKARSALAVDSILRTKPSFDSIRSGKQQFTPIESFQDDSILSETSSAQKVEDLLRSQTGGESTAGSTAPRMAPPISRESTGSAPKWAKRGMFASPFTDDSICFESTAGSPESAKGTGIPSDLSGVYSRPMPPRRASKRMTPLALSRCVTPDLCSPSATEISSEVLTDAQSAVNLSILGGANTFPRHSKRPSAYGQPSEPIETIEEEAATLPPGSLSLLRTARPGLTPDNDEETTLESWMRLQREADVLIGLSHDMWPDTPESKAVMSGEQLSFSNGSGSSLTRLTGFQAPSEVLDILAFLDSSLKLHRSLDEASPGRQIDWRLVRDEDVREKKEEASKTLKSVSLKKKSQPSVTIPTKFSRTNLYTANASGRPSLDDDNVPPVSALLAKFVVPPTNSQPSPTFSNVINKPRPAHMADASTKIKVGSISKKTERADIRPRVASAVRREHLGWGRRHPYQDKLTLPLPGNGSTTMTLAPGTDKSRPSHKQYLSRVVLDKENVSGSVKASSDYVRQRQPSQAPATKLMRI